MKKAPVLLYLLLMFTTSITFAKVKLPALITDGMVLQREQKLKIWGWADVGEEVTINFHNQTYKTTTGKDKKWSVILPATGAGGPYTMLIKGNNEIKIDDILIGDVWLCSGQSNMAFKMDRIKGKYAKEIATSANENIRQFAVNTSWSFAVQDDIESDGWKYANPKSVLDFTAVGYFFARAMYEKTKVPVGIINSSYSATVAEAWTSEEGLKEFPDFIAEANKFKVPGKVEEVQQADKELRDNWFKLSTDKDLGSPGDGMSWADSRQDVSAWETLTVPGYWDKPDIKNKPGVVWMVKEIDISTQLAGKKASLFFGAIDDRDITYFNGVKVGSSYMRGRSRTYEIPGNLIKAGKNRIVVRILNPDGPGGFYPDKKNKFISGDSQIDLNGTWSYKIGAKLPALRSNETTKFNLKPTTLFNSMIAPLTNYTLKGVVWYQGEGNAGRAYEYRKLFSSLITDWRKKWSQDELPFLFVQLANYGKVRDEPADASWAELREAQSLALALPMTGMAVIHDIGETNDIHPQNKKTVGDRLALVARKVAYGENIVSSGPVYESMKIQGDSVIISFKQLNSNLVTKDSDELKYFAIAGTDKKFVWAKAKIQGDKIVVWSEDVKQPVAVRYAWADNPLGANLYNMQGLPASSFRTDKWEGKTFKK